MSTSWSTYIVHWTRTKTIPMIDSIFQKIRQLNVLAAHLISPPKSKNDNIIIRRHGNKYINWPNGRTEKSTPACPFTTINQDTIKSMDNLAKKFKLYISSMNNSSLKVVKKQTKSQRVKTLSLEHFPTRHQANELQ